ncbi:uncharacterized protein K441DRAFT_688957 [Cenococcum geophilum 1.58]|uniref:uncharacterized protein n=1 Tax=Cenococcum geophilum 1.58 TaxID=794803 RepID=UPI00358F486A|nr:hypothetical protein K441DRAFT_688957 [Cenococcum geophilum 1.58]
MGKLIKNHWACLIILTAATYQPKILWDFLTKNLNGAVKPIPPLKFITGTSTYQSIKARLIIFPLSALAAVLQYQSTNAALYYIIGIGVYF